MSEWLEAELTSALRPAQAPPGLWGRVLSPRAPARGWLVPAIALVLLVASVDLLWEFSKARGGLRQGMQPDAAEIAAIAGSEKRCDLYSDDPGRIRQWVKSRSGIDIELPQHSSAVRLVGARLVNLRGTLVASVAYESGTGPGTMLVWKNGQGNGQAAKHVFRETGARAEMVSWTRGENAFAAPREACLLCHPEGGHGI